MDKEKTIGSTISVTIDGKKIGEIKDCSISSEDIHEVLKTDECDDMEYNYLFTIADLILELHLENEAKKEIPKWAWTQIINAMIEFKKSTDY